MLKRLVAAEFGIVCATGTGCERLAWQTLRAIHLVMYASPKFRKQVLAVRGGAVATGIGNLVGNKV